MASGIPDAAAVPPAAVGERLAAGGLLEWLLIPLGLVLSLVTFSHVLVGDDRARFQMLSTLLEYRRLLPIKYSLVGPILAAPFWFAGKAMGNPAAAVGLYDWLLLCVGLVAFHFVLRRHASPVLVRRFLLLLVAGSMFPRHVLHFGAEPFTNLAAGIGLALAGLDVTWGWGLAIAGVLNTPAAQPALAFAAARRAWDERRFRYLLVPVVAVVLALLEMWLRLGALFRTGYEGDAGLRTVMPYSGRPGFSYPIFFGLLSELLSFGKGLAWFAPGLWLLLRGRRLDLPEALRPVLRLWLAFLLALLLLYGKYWGWYGGVSAGPRYFLFASLPATLLLAAFLARPPAGWGEALAALALLGLSCWGVVATTIFEGGGLDLCTANGYALENLCWYTPEFSVLWNPFVGPLRALTVKEWSLIGYEAAVVLVLGWPALRALAASAWRGAGVVREALGSFRV